METTIETAEHSSTTSHLSIRLLCIKHLQQTSAVIKVAIVIILSSIVAIIGWQIHVNTGERNDNQSSQGSTLVPQVIPASFPIQSWKYIEQFLDSSVSNDTLYKCLSQRRKKLLQFEKDIRRFMNQKMAIEKLFRHVNCPKVDHKDINDIADIDIDDFDSAGDLKYADDVAEWYNFILTSKPTIHIQEDTIYMPTLKVDRFDFDDICYTHNGDILHINVSRTRCNGSVDLTSLPQSLEILKLHGTKFSGSVDLTSLPQSLKELKLHANQFTGTVDLTSLPQSLTEVWVAENKFIGSVDLTSLPNDLESLILVDNQFTGTVDLTSLPRSLEILVLSENDFTGSINLKSLPQSLGMLTLDDNNFTGSVDLTSLPPLMEYLTLSDNPHFTGILDLRKIPHQLLDHLKYSEDQFDAVIPNIDV